MTLFTICVLCQFQLPLCVHRYHPANLILAESMDRAHPGSRKRANPLVVPSNERLCHHPCHEDHSQHCPRGPKRQRPEPSLIGHASPSNAFATSVNSSAHNALNRNLSNTYTETNVNINVFADGLSLFPPLGTPLGFPPYLGVDDQPSQQQDVEVTNNAAGTSATYTVTDGTLSPRSTNQQVLVNTNDGTTQSPGGASELLFDDIDFDLDNVWPWNTSNSAFDRSGRSSF
jgi:hypothetical protein